MEPITLATSFASIVSLIGQYIGEHSEKEKVEFNEFLEWLVKTQHEDIKELLEQNTNATISVKAYLHDGISTILNKLESMTDSASPITSEHGLSLSCSWGIVYADLENNEKCYIWDINGSSKAPATIHAVTAWLEYYNSKLNNINIYTITNHSSIPIFELKLPVQIECWKRENAENLDGNRAPPERQVNINLPVTDKKLMPGEELVFFINSVSGFHIEITFSEIMIGSTLNSKAEIHLPLKMESWHCSQSVFFGGHQTLNQWLSKKSEINNEST